LKIAVILHSETGTTRKTIYYIAEKLEMKEISIDVFEVKSKSDYRRPLHLNPKLIYHTLKGKNVEIEIEPCMPRLEEYDLLILASPIWIGRITPPMRTFIRKFKGKGMKTICITTSRINREYSKVLRRIAEEEGGLNVIYDENLVNGAVSEELIERLLKLSGEINGGKV